MYDETVLSILVENESVSTIPDECMGVELEIVTSGVLGNEAPENRSGRLFYNRTEVILL